MFNFSFTNPRHVLFLVLLFCVASSKNIIIYNEETLVTASFFLFMLFLFHYSANTLAESLDERSDMIRNECQNFSLYKEQSLQQLAAEYSQIGQLEHAASQLMIFTKENCTQCSTTGVQSLETAFSQQIIQKCNELQHSPLPQQCISLMAASQKDLVLAHCANAELKKLPTAVLKNAIKLFAKKMHL